MINNSNANNNNNLSDTELADAIKNAEIRREIHNKKELSEDEMNKVDGGASPYTRMGYFSR
jgi:bacteriocin-like protein